MSLLSDTEVRQICHLLSPEFAYHAAADYGGGNLILGSLDAYQEARRQVRHILWVARQRHYRRIELEAAAQYDPQIQAQTELMKRAGAAGKQAAADRQLRLMRLQEDTAAKGRADIRKRARADLEALGYRWRRSILLPLPHPERDYLCKMWSEPEDRHSTRRVQVGKEPAYKTFELAAIQAMGDCLREIPDLNRAVLPPRHPQRSVYWRDRPDVMVYVRLDREVISPLIVEPVQPAALRDLKKQLLREMRKQMKVRQHKLLHRGLEVLSWWNTHGFLASPAGASVTSVGQFSWKGAPSGLDEPTGGLIPVNGIPLCLALGRITKHTEHTELGTHFNRWQLYWRLHIDHRAFDAEHGAEIQDFLEKRIPEYL